MPPPNRFDSVPPRPSGPTVCTVCQRGEALAIFERDLIVHFQQISRAAALYIRALLGGVKRALEIYRRVDETTKNFPWSVPSTEEKWHSHAEGVLMVALTTLSLPTEAWKSARLLRAVPNCRLVLMLSYHMLSPTLSVEETGLMTYLQTPPEAGPSIVQVISGLQNWKCAGRRLVEVGGRLPTATQLHQSFIKILSKHLAANKKVNFVFQQQSSTIPMMNPSQTEIVELFSFVEVSLIQCATVAGHFPGVTALSVKPKPKKINKVEVATDEPSKGEAQVNATTPTTPRPKPKAQSRSNPQSTPTKVESKPPETKKGGTGGGKSESEPRVERRKQQCIHFFRGTCQKGDQCRYEHQVGDDGQAVPVGPEILQRFDDAVKRYSETRVQAEAKPKAAPRGGVSSPMIIIEPENVERGIVLSAAQALDNDEYYAMLDSGTNAIIVPLHPKMQGDIAECQVPSATVTGPIVQVYEFDGATRLVVALPQSAILVSREWLTTIAGWTFVSGPKPGLKSSVCENKAYPAGADICAQHEKWSPISLQGIVLDGHGRHCQKGEARLRT